MTAPVTDPTPPADPPATDPTPQAPPADPPTETDWKAESRKWEKRAKENDKAAAELEKLKASQLSDQEKAVEAARLEGRTAAAADYGTKLAKAEFRAAVAAAGLDLGDASDLIDTSRFVGADGEVDTAAIGEAVKKLAKVAKPTTGRSGGDMSGGSGEGRTGKRPTSISAAVAAAYKR
jgi:hypothetical protein